MEEVVPGSKVKVYAVKVEVRTLAFKVSAPE